MEVEDVWKSAAAPGKLRGIDFKGRRNCLKCVYTLFADCNFKKSYQNSALHFWSDGTRPQRKVIYNEKNLCFRKELHFSRQTFGWWLNKQRCDCSPILTLSLFFIKSFCSLAQKEPAPKKVGKGGFLRRI